MRRFTVALSTLVPGLIGVVVIAATLHKDRTAKIARDWPSVSGEVVAAESRHSERYLGRNVSKDEYFPVTTYRYLVAGKQYQSSRIRSLEHLPRFESAEEAAKAAGRQFPIGSQVEVFYDPQDPASAFLDRRVEPGRGGMLIALGCLLIAIGLALGWLVGRLMPAVSLPQEPFFVCSNCQCELPLSELATRGRCSSCSEA